MKDLPLLILILIIAFPVQSQIPSDNLEAYYPFNGNANDISGNGHNCTVLGASLSTDRFGNPNSAYYFDGIDDYINTFTTFDLSNRTISFWANPDAINRTGFNSCGAIWQDYTDHNNGVILADFRNGLLQLNAGGVNSYVDNTISDKTWIHIVMTRTTDSLKYYINGNLVGVGISEDFNSTYEPYEYLVIGTDRTRSRRFFEGKIDDIRIYSDALTECEIWSLFKENTEIFDLSISQNDNSLTSNDTNTCTTYQWFDCNNNTPIIGETNQTFIASSNGSYAVILNNGIYSKTTECYTVQGQLDITDINFVNELSIHPNPTHENVIINLGNINRFLSISLISFSGQIIWTKDFHNSSSLQFKIDQPAGMYFVEITGEKGEKALLKVIKR